jgi:peptidoglycan hydrolase-like protein with peptidoglycan-binding domain
MKYIFLAPLFVLLLSSPASAATSVLPQCVTLSINLHIKSTDAATHGAVTTLQNFLIVRGQLHAAATGYFGALTFGAATSFQKEQGIPPTGFVGPLTRARIGVLTCSQAQSIGTGGDITALTPFKAPQTFGSTTQSPSFSGVSSGGGSTGGASSNLPDPKTAYLAMKAEYDAAPTLDAFVAVSGKYASAARQADVLAQAASLSDLSAADQNDILNSTIRSIVPSLAEFGTVTASENGTTATIVVTSLPASGKTAVGTIVLVLEGGSWKLQSEKWQDLQGNGIEPLPAVGGG